MIRVYAQKLRDRILRGAAAMAQKVAHLMLGKAVFSSETHQSPALYPDLCFHPFGFEGH